MDNGWLKRRQADCLIRGQTEPFHHTDRNRLSKIAEPTPNPLARG